MSPQRCRSRYAWHLDEHFLVRPAAVRVAPWEPSAVGQSKGRPPDSGIGIRAAHVERLRVDLHRRSAARDGTEQARQDWSAAAVAFKEAARSFYQPNDDLGPRIRTGDRAAVDEAADSWRPTRGVSARAT